MAGANDDGALEIWPYALNESNLVQVKVYKTASTTMSSVVRRIAGLHHMSGIRTAYWKNPEPLVWAEHSPYWKMLPHMDYHKLPTFLVTFVREPRKRAISQYYHEMVTRAHQGTATKDVIAWLSGQKLRDLQYHYINSGHDANVQEAMAHYAFIGTVELWAESMAIFSYMLSLHVGEVVSLSTKVSTKQGHDDLGKAFVPDPLLTELEQDLQDWLNGDFLTMNRQDVELWETATTRVEAILEAHPEMRERAERYRTLCLEAEEVCGQYWDKDCFHHDEGCGHHCLHLNLFQDRD